MFCRHNSLGPTVWSFISYIFILDEERIFLPFAPHNKVLVTALVKRKGKTKYYRELVGPCHYLQLQMANKSCFFHSTLH